YIYSIVYQPFYFQYSISWRFNMNVLRENAIDTGSFPEIIGKTFDKPTMFIGGERSHFLKKEDEADTKRYFPSAEFHYVPGAGHLVHADRPQEFINICVNFLSESDNSETVELVD
ncbi:hydrolase, partial [Oryctes borbonicus]